MYSFNDNLNKQDYDNFIKNYSMASFMQEYNWSYVKDNWNSFHCGLYKDKKLVGVCLILVKKIFLNIKLFYIPRGYLIDFSNFEDLKEMTKNIKMLAKRNKAYVVKLDPNFCISEKSFKEEEREKNYSKDSKIKCENLKKLGYKYTGTHKEIGSSLQPQYNVFAPLCDKDSKILSYEEILSTYKSKLRYYLGDFQEKRGVSFEITDDINRVDDFIKVLKQTEQKQKISLRSKEYFEKVLKNFKNYAYLIFANIDLDKYLDFLKTNNGKQEEIDEVVDVIKNQGKNIVVSASLFIIPKNTKGIRTSEYLYAGNSLNFRNLHVSQALVFEIIKFSANKNCHYCNLGGVDGNLNDHLTSFKQKFNGIVMEFAGEYDLPVSKLYYPIKLFYPIILKIYKFIKKEKKGHN